MTKAKKWQEPAWLTYCSREAMRRRGKALVRHGLILAGFTAVIGGYFYAVDGEWLIFGLAVAVASGSFGYDALWYISMRKRLRRGTFGSITKEARMIDAVLLEVQKKAGIGGPETAATRFFSRLLSR